MGEHLATTRTIGTTGATGAVGGKVAARLARRGVPQRLIVRDLNRAPELAGSSATMAAYEDPDAFRRAVRGTDVLLLVSATEQRDRAALHTRAVDAAVEAGVRHIVYLSFLNAAPAATFTFARDHFATEAHIRATGVDHTFLRPSLYLDLLPRWIGADGTLRGPAGNGRVAWVARDDIADVAAAVLCEPERHVNRTYDVTGPEAVSLAQTVDRLSALTGRTLSYVPQTWEEALASRSHLGAPAWAVRGWVSSYAAIAAGELDTVSTAVTDLTGHPARSIEGHLRTNPSALSHVHT